jgi:Primase C terminal 1 (PriCT-1)
MIDLTGITHNPALEEIVGVLCNKTSNTDRGFFRAEVAFFLGKMASNMRVTIVTKDRGDIPVNIYALALATSGFGKGHSVNIVENEIMRGFKRRFMEETLPIVAEKNLWDIANDRSLRNGSDPNEEFEKAETEYKRAGVYPFTFDSGTVPAVKQLRHKLLLANAGAISLQIDEIGSNLIGNVEVLNAYLELYDQGIIKNKLTKNTSENTRGEEIDGKTPTNLLLFGTPAKLFDGGQTEEQFYSFLETGYARRCIFGLGHQDRKAFHTQTPEEMYARSIKTDNNAVVTKWSQHFHRLADPAVFGWKLAVNDEVGITLLKYKIACERAAEEMPDHEEVRKSEISHRYFRALKLAGAYAFVEQSIEIEMQHLLQAILLVEESGIAFQNILKREKTYVKLAKYIAGTENEVTHADLNEALPFYKSGNAARNEMMTMAMAWGYKQHIIIKKRFEDGIEFFKGETLEMTDLESLRVAYSDNWAYNYQNETAQFEELHLMTQEPGIHWTNHHFRNGHRAEENVVTGFNMLVLDVDKGVTMTMAHELMREYKFLTYTTKRHTEEHNRFRMILPINYTLYLDSEEYKEFMNNVMSWLPFEIDESANQRARKWESCDKGTFHYNLEGEMVDALAFIPKTTKNEQWKAANATVQSLDNLERWFAQRIASGNRNNQMIKFALALVDSGMDFMTISQQVKAFNEKLSNKLPDNEIDSTILQTVSKKMSKLA